MSCKDGICDDPAFPFCDVDGALEGIPETCIAVSCTPGEFEACRGDQVIRCNATGNDFELVECEVGCSDAVGGCSSCSTNEQCANPTPVCDGMGTCRACAVDDECDSRVCDADSGTCVSEASVVYAAPEGSNTATFCTQETPCSLARAVSDTLGSSIPIVLRMLPGTYTEPLVADVATPDTRSIVGTGAILSTGPEDALIVSGGANVEVRDLEITTTSVAVAARCGTGTASRLVILRSRLVPEGPGVPLVLGDCDVTVSDTVLVSLANPMSIGSDSRFTGDRLHIESRPPAVSQIVTSGTNVSVRLTNSVLRNVGVITATGDAAPPGSQLFYAYNTFVFTEDGLNGAQVNCFGSSAPRTMRFENNIMFSATAEEPVLGDRCAMVNNVVAPFAGLLPGNILASPRFVDVANGDFHLQADSPALDAAVPSQVALDVDHDFENTARPQGPKSDIGAFERTP